MWGDKPITKDGEAVVTIKKPGLFTMDINRKMDDHDTGIGMLPKNRGVYEGQNQFSLKMLVLAKV